MLHARRFLVGIYRLARMSVDRAGGGDSKRNAKGHAVQTRDDPQIERPSEREMRMSRGTPRIAALLYLYR